MRYEPDRDPPQMETRLREVLNWFLLEPVQGDGKQTWARFLVVLSVCGVPFLLAFAARYWFDLSAGVGCLPWDRRHRPAAR